MRGLKTGALMGGLALVTAGLSAPTAAQADAGRDAKYAYERGKRHFKAQRYVAALAAFESAYKLDPSPVLLYNIARCYEETGDVAMAKANFNAYLKRVPDAPDRADVERRIRVMEAVAARSKADPVPAAPVSSTDPGTAAERGVTGRAAPPSTGPSALSWTLLGAGALGAVAGAVFGVRATDLDEQYTGELDDPRRKRDLRDDAESAARWANISYGVGGALVVGGLLVWLFDDDAPVAPTATPEGFGLFGRF